MSAEAGYSDTGREMFLPIVDPVEGKQQNLRVTCDFHLTDLGNALRLVADCGANIRYCPTQNTWYIWNGVQWVVDTTNRIKEIAKQRVKLIHAEAAFVDKADTKEQKAKQKEIENWAFKSESEYRIAAMIALAESDDRIVVEPRELNGDPNLLNCLSGTIDFKNCPRDKPVREHRREDLITKVCPVRYNSDAKGQLWYDTLFGALPADVVFFLQDAFGYSCIFTMEEKAFLFLYGIPDGRKSSVLDPAFSVLGDYAHAFHYSTFMKKGARASSARPDIIDMEGLRAAQCSELPKGFVIDDALIKSLTSANPQHVRNLYDRYMHDVTVKATFWFESNFMAKIDFEDQANFNRLNVIVFNRPLEKVDKSVLEKLMTDAEEREAIFAWIVDGAFEWREHGLQRPAEVNAATKEYQRTMNPLTWFIDGHCEKKDGAKIGASELHKRFKSIAETMPREFQRTIQAEMLSVANFGRTMKKLGFVSKHTESGSVYEGLTIPDTWEEIEYR